MVPQPLRVRQDLLKRKLFLVLSITALVYSFLAGLRTVKDNDLGWQLSTGRWVIQHHRPPPVEAFSYTARGEFIYPVGAGVVFYLAYLLGGYVLLSWIGAAASCGSVALLLRRGSAASAAIAILAVPLIAWRTAPRADLFTVVLFAAFLSLLWENYETGRARLWLLPPLMVFWVNLHLGFSSGLGLIGMYVVVEGSEAFVSVERRRAASARLHRAVVPFIGTVLATLVNPWGWNIYRALVRQERVIPQHQIFFQEWHKVPVAWSLIADSLSLRHTGGTIYLILAIAILSGVIALFRDRPGAGIVLLAATVPALRYVRMGAVFACVVVVVGGYVLSNELPQFLPAFNKVRIRSALVTAVGAIFVLLAAVRCFDLVTNRFYYSGTEESNFGAGLGWWFPQRAVEFIKHENLPGEVFNTYTEGGFVSFALGPDRRDYIDGRGIPFGIERIERETQLRQSPPDSPVWQEEIERYNINTVLLPIARIQGVHFVRLLDFCNSRTWQPVYMDEVSAVFVRRSTENELFLSQFPVNCATAPLPPVAPANGAAAFNAWSNAAAVLAALGRNAEALNAAEKGLAVYPGGAYLHIVRGGVFYAEGRFDDAEREYLGSIALDPSEAAWNSLADVYAKQGRVLAEIDAEQRAARLSRTPWMDLLNVGYIYLDQGQAEDALAQFDLASHSVAGNKPLDNGQFDFMLTQGRARAWDQLGNLAKATSFEEQAASVRPNVPQVWRQLALLYRRQGRVEDADHASARAAQLEGNHGR